MTLSELLGEAGKLGQPVSADQFRRWRGRGLMHAPTLTSKGRAKGIAASYDASHLRQMVAVAITLKEDHRVDRVMWKLWMQGYAIDERRILKQLAGTLQSIDKTRKIVRKIEASDRASKRFEKATEARLFNNGLAGIRRRLHKQRYNSFMTVTLQLVTGLYDTQSAEDDEALVLFAFGLVDTLEPKPSLAAFPSGFLRKMSANFSKTRLEQGLRGLQPQQLVEARDALRPVLSVLGALLPHFAPAAMKTANALFTQPTRQGLNQIFESPPELLFLAWLGVRQHPDFPGFYKELLLLPKRASEYLALNAAPPLSRTKP